MDQIKNESTLIIYDELDISKAKTAATEKEVIESIAERVRYLLDNNVDLLMSYLYRLDVLEHKIHNALKGENIISTDMILAQLIFDRQVLRLKIKKKYKVDPIDELDY